MSTTTAKGFLAAGVVAGLKSSGNRDVDRKSTRLNSSHT